MANFNCNMVYLFYLMMVFFWFGHFSASAFEFQVGGNKDWVVPPANDTKIYNDWASENRFQIGDTIRFHYKKDSVMEVTEAEYKKCNSTRPNFFSNTGNTVYTLDHSGSFYFISGAAGHCERGQRMIVKVMAAEEEDFPLVATPKDLPMLQFPQLESSSMFLFRLLCHMLLLLLCSSLID